MNQFGTKGEDSGTRKTIEKQGYPAHRCQGGYIFSVFSRIHGRSGKVHAY